MLREITGIPVNEKKEVSFGRTGRRVVLLKFVLCYVNNINVKKTNEMKIIIEFLQQKPNLELVVVSLFLIWIILIVGPIKVELKEQFTRLCVVSL